MTDIIAAQRDIIESSHRGLIFLLVTGIGWLVCGGLAWRLSLKPAALVVLFQGFVTIPAAFVVERLLGFPQGAADNPLTQLAIYLAISQSVAIPAVIIVYLRAPEYVPAALAAIVGAHFLPYAWLEQSTAYAVLGVAVGWVPFFLMRFAKQRGIWIVPMFVGSCLVAATSFL